MLLFLMGHIITTAYAKNTPALATESAQHVFQFSATVRDAQTIIAKWRIKPEHYLYKSRLHFKILAPKQAKLGHILFPPAQTKTFLGDATLYAVYQHTLTIAVPVIMAAHHTTVTLQVTYQGCSETGYCYRPRSEIVVLPLNQAHMQFVSGTLPPLALTQAHATKNITTTKHTQLTWVTRLFHKGNPLVFLFGFLMFGLLLAFTPCVLPMVPILSAILSGQKTRSTARSFALSLMYVLGMSISYAIAGILFSFIGNRFQMILHTHWISILFAMLFVAMALSLFGSYSIHILARWQRFTQPHLTTGGHYIGYMGSALMGAGAVLMLSPCVTPALVGILSYMSQTGNIPLGGIALFIMGIGMGLPLLLIGLMGDHCLPRTGPWMERTKHLLGIMMLALALIMVQRVLDGPLMLLLWAMLAIGSAIYLETFNTAASTSYTQWFAKGLGLIITTVGIVLIVSATTGQPINISAPFHPFTSPNHSRSSPQSSADFFTPVTNIKTLQNELRIAQHNKQPVLLDFYANWCIACQIMDRVIFSDVKVKQALSHFRVLRADMTKNTPGNQKLQQSLGIVAPPTVLFFFNGQEIPNSRIIGEISKKDFLRALTSFRSFKEGKMIWRRIPYSFSDKDFGV